MLTILIVDDEKPERRGIRFLLEQREDEFEILEAQNGRAACETLKSKPVDIMFTDIKMPFMDGLELVGRAKELCPDMEMVIFSGYGEFEYARKAMRAGVENYVLKPVDPKEFHATLDAIIEKIGNKQKQEKEKRANQDFLNQYFLGKYLYQGNAEHLERLSDRVDITDWKQIRGMLLIESEDNFFEESETLFIEKLTAQFDRKFLFLNQGQNQELCVLLDGLSLPVLADKVCRWLCGTFGAHFYVAASRPISDVKELPAAFNELEMLMENRFYQKDRRLFLPGKTLDEAAEEQFLDDILNRMIENIRLDDIMHLWEHFQVLQANAARLNRYSQIYTKFLFSNLVKELCVHQHIEGKKLETMIQQVYELRSVQEVFGIVESLIRELERRLEVQGSNARNEVAQAKSYIYAHYSEDISVETLAELVYLSPGYFSYIFKKETGENVSRFIRRCRMEKAKELLSDTNMKIVQICKETGFSNVSYFCKSFREYCGCSPEQYRKGAPAGEEAENEME